MKLQLNSRQVVFRPSTESEDLDVQALCKMPDAKGTLVLCTLGFERRHFHEARGHLVKVTCTPSCSVRCWLTVRSELRTCRNGGYNLRGRRCPEDRGRLFLRHPLRPFVQNLFEDKNHAVTSLKMYSHHPSPSRTCLHSVPAHSVRIMSCVCLLLLILCVV